MSLNSILGLTVDPAQILALEGLTDRLSSADAAYISGSRVDGTGNAWSDVDVFVIGDVLPSGPKDVRDGDAYLANHLLGSIRVDFEFWTSSSISRLHERIARIDLSAQAMADDMFLAYRDLVFLNRLRIGIPIFGENVFETIKRSFDYEKIRQCRIRQLRQEVDGTFEDLGGMLESEDFDVAYFRAQDLLGFSIDCLLAAAGNLNPNPKWRVKILARFSEKKNEYIDASWVTEFWRLSFPNVIELRGDATLRDDHFTSVIRLSNKIMDRVYE